MAKSLDDAEFWLPPQFLSDHEKLVGKENIRAATRFDSPVSFPSEFPYEFETFGANSTLDSPVESVVSSNETESSDEEDFLAALTQRLSQSTLQRPTVPGFTQNKSKAKVAMAGSPQSTLCGFGSLSCWSTVSSDGSPNGPSQAPSPPTTPFGAENNTWDLIYAAAGQVARLKMAGDGIIGPRSSNLVSSLKNPPTGLYSNTSPFQYGTEDPIFSLESSSTWGRHPKVATSVQQSQNQQIYRRGRDFPHEDGRFGRPLDLPQHAWPTLQVHRRSDPSQLSTPAMPPVFPGGGSAPRKECAGTGVFLPRRYENPPQSCRPVSVFPAKSVHGRNRSFEDPNRSSPSQTLTNRRLAPSSVADALIARRNVIVAQQRLYYHRPTEGAKSHELLLPQEWTY